MLYEPKSSDIEEKEGDNISINRIVNLKVWQPTYIWLSVKTMYTLEGSTDENRKGKRPGKLHFLCWGLSWSNSSGSKE